MSFYNHFNTRDRSKIGEKIKLSFANKIFSLIINHSKINNIIDLGPGDGYIAKFAKSMNIKYLGIEESSEIALKLKSNGYEIIDAKIPPLPNNIGKFDACFALHIIEHLNSISEAEDILHQISNILNDGGKLIIATPDYLRWKQDFYNCDYTHNLPFTMKRLKQLLTNSDFNIVYSDYYFGNILGVRGLPLFGLVKILYSHILDQFISKKNKSDIWYRGYLTFLPSILVIAEKTNF